LWPRTTSHRRSHGKTLVLLALSILLAGAFPRRSESGPLFSSAFLS
jgi:hypothetical protein